MNSEPESCIFDINQRLLFLPYLANLFSEFFLQTLPLKYEGSDHLPVLMAILS